MAGRGTITHCDDRATVMTTLNRRILNWMNASNSKSSNQSPIFINTNTLMWRDNVCNNSFKSIYFIIEIKYPLFCNHTTKGAAQMLLCYSNAKIVNVGKLIAYCLTYVNQANILYFSFVTLVFNAKRNKWNSVEVAWLWYVSPYRFP